MTSYFTVTPSAVAAPSFTPTLDGNVYTCTVVWSLFGQRYYLYCYDSNNDLIFTVPVITSPQAQGIAEIYWDAASLRAFVTTATPHKLKVGTVVNLVISGVVPSGFNGTFDCSVTSPTTLFYPLNVYPGNLVTLGDWSYVISMSKGYFNSTIVYRNGQFEVSP